MLDYLAQNADAKIVGLVALLFLWDLRKSFKEMAESVRVLAEQMAVIVERVDGHEKRIDRLEA